METESWQHHRVAHESGCCSSFVPIVETERRRRYRRAQRPCRVAAHSFRLWKLKAMRFAPSRMRWGQVAAHSFRLWKLKAAAGNITVETWSYVAAHSFRLWKLKVGNTIESHMKVDAGCSSFVPIVETERRIFHCSAPCKFFVAAHSFRLWKLKV